MENITRIIKETVEKISAKRRLNKKLLLIVLMLVMSWLLVSEVPMFALKFKHWGLRQDNNAVKYAFVAFSVIALCVGQIAAIALIIVAYIIVSVVLSWTSGNKQGQIE